MKKNSKEFEELRTQFELDLKTMPVYTSSNPEREARDSRQYYCNGTINSLFIGYMYGYESAKALARMDALDLNS